MFVFMIFTLVGVICALLGWVIRSKKKYNLIAGVNTASDDEKKQMNLEAIGRVMGTVMMLSGLGWVIAGGLFYLGLEWALYAWIIIFLIVIYGSIIHVQKYDGGNVDDRGRVKKKAYAKINIALIPAFIILVVVGTLLYRNTLEPVVTIQDDVITVDCIFGTAISKSDVTNVLWIDAIPRGSRYFGGDVMGSLKGRFGLDNLGTGEVYARRDAGPYILLKLQDSYVILGLDTSEKTRALYKAIEGWLSDARDISIARLDSSPNPSPRIMTLDDVRQLAAKGESLTMADLKAFIGRDNLSGLYGWQIDIDDVYALQSSNGDGRGALFVAMLYERKEAGKSIDIRYYDIDRFLNDGAQVQDRPTPTPPPPSIPPGVR